jgi:hypothetical protein
MSVMGQFSVTSVETGKQKLVLLAMSPKVAGLVASALEVVNPDSDKMETLARAIALRLEQEG